MYTIDTMDKWHDAARRLSARGYTLFQTQFDVDCPEGFIARFIAPNDARPRVEIATHDAKVRDAMRKFKG